MALLSGIFNNPLKMGAARAAGAVSSDAMSAEGVASGRDVELKDSAEHIARLTVNRMVDPQYGWIPSPSGKDVLDEYQKVVQAGYAVTGTFPDALVFMSEHISRASKEDYEQVSAIAAQNTARKIPLCDFAAKLHVPKMVYRAGGERAGIAVQAFRLNCPVLAAENGGESLVLGGLNYFALAEVKRFIEATDFPPYVSLMRLSHEQWVRLMEEARQIVIPL